MNITGTVPAAMLADRKIKSLADELARLSEAADSAYREEQDAKAALNAAPAADIDATARAVRSGADDPGNAATVAAESRLAAAERRRAGIRQATQAVAGELSETVRERLPKLREAAAREAEEAGRAAVAATEELDSAISRVATARATDRWLVRTARREPARMTPDDTDNPILSADDSRGGRSYTRWHNLRDALMRYADLNRAERERQVEARSLRPGVPQNLTPEELVHGRKD